MFSIKKIAVASAVAAALGLATLTPFVASSMASADGAKPGAWTTSIESGRIYSASESEQVLSLITALAKNRADLQALDMVAQQGRLVAISRDAVIIAVPDARTEAVALEVAALIEQALSQMVGAEVGVEFVIDGSLPNSDEKGSENEGSDDQSLGGGGVPGRSGGSLPGGSGNGGGNGQDNGCGGEQLDQFGSRFVQGLMDGEEEDEPKEDEPKEEDKGEEEGEEGENGENGEENSEENGENDGNNNENGNDVENEEEGTDWDAVGDAIVNFLKGVAGALTGFFGSVGMSSPTTVEEARDFAEGVDSLDRHREFGTGNKHAAEQMKQSDALRDHPDIGGSADPCEGYNWFRQALPHLTGTQWDPYARVDALKDGDPSNQTGCGPTANPNPDGSCEEQEAEVDESTLPDNGLGPDCDTEEGCGSAPISPAALQKLMLYSDPTNPCGIYANVGPDGNCSEEGEEEVPLAPQPEPDCEVCGVSTSSVSTIGGATAPNPATISTSPGSNTRTQVDRNIGGLMR